MFSESNQAKTTARIMPMIPMAGPELTKEAALLPVAVDEDRLDVGEVPLDLAPPDGVEVGVEPPPAVPEEVGAAGAAPPPVEIAEAITEVEFEFMQSVLPVFTVNGALKLGTPASS